jgi:hypothetical protein
MSAQASGLLWAGVRHRRSAQPGAAAPISLDQPAGVEQTTQSAGAVPQSHGQVGLVTALRGTHRERGRGAHSITT